MNIARHVERGQRLFADRVAIAFEGRHISYGELSESAGRFASGLLGLGISRGDRVALFLPNSPEWVIAYLGILRIGAIAVSINPSLKTEELRFLLNDSGARAVISTKLARDNFNAKTEGGKDGRDSSEDAQVQWLVIDEAMHSLMRSAPAGVDAVEMERHDPAVIVYTSGTTGFPKGAVLSHGNVISNIEAKRRYLGIEPQDRLLLFLPLFHCFGQNAILNSAFESGATVVLERHFDEARVRESIEESGVTMFFGVPTTYLILCDRASVEEMSGVRYFFSAASSLPREIEERWERKFGRVIHQGYGLTETSPFASYNHLQKHKAGSIGTPIEHVEMKVRSIEDGSDLAAGESGEIVIRGPNVMLGYWNRPEETAEALSNGWFRTGDIGRCDSEGYFFLEDRLKDMVNVGGLKVFPAEIENIILQQGAIADAAVYGVPNELFGERVIASVVLKQGQTLSGDSIRAFCREKLAEYKVPDEIEFLESIPRNPTGKVLKRVLRERHAVNLVQTSSDERVRSDRRGTETSVAVVSEWIAGWLMKTLQIRSEEIDGEKSFFDYGLTSSQAMQLSNDAGEWLGTPLGATLAWRFPTIETLAQHLTDPKSEPEAQESAAKIEVDTGDFSMAEIAELLTAEIAASKQRKSR